MKKLMAFALAAGVLGVAACDEGDMALVKPKALPSASATIPPPQGQIQTQPLMTPTPRPTPTPTPTLAPLPSPPASAATPALPVNEPAASGSQF